MYHKFFKPKEHTIQCASYFPSYSKPNFIIISGSGTTTFCKSLALLYDTTKKLYFFQDASLLQIHLLFFTLLPQAVAGRKIHTLCQDKTDLSGCQWWKPEHRLALLGATLNTSLYYVNFYLKVSGNVLIKYPGVDICMYVYFKMLFGPCHELGFSHRPYIVVDYLHFQSWPYAFWKIWDIFSCDYLSFLISLSVRKWLHTFTLFHLSLSLHNLGDWWRC